jgi:hypothetical protein
MNKAIKWLLMPLLLFASFGLANAQVVGSSLCGVGVSASGTLACSSSVNQIANGVNANAAASIFQLSNVGYLLAIAIIVIFIIMVVLAILERFGLFKK